MLNIPDKIKCHHLYPKAQSSKNWEANHKAVTTPCDARGMKNKDKSFPLDCRGYCYKLLKISYLEKL